MTEESPDRVEIDPRAIELAFQARQSGWLGCLILCGVLVWAPLALGWDDLVVAWPRLEFFKSGVFGFAIGFSVLTMCSACLVLLFRRDHLRSRRSVVCPGCLYTISDAWDQSADSLVRCPECGRCFWMFAYMTAAAPSARRYAWSWTIRHRWGRLLIWALTMSALVGGVGGALAVVRFPNETFFNFAGIVTASSAAGLSLALAAADISLMRTMARWEGSSVCPCGHPGFMRKVGNQRSLCWCDVCSDGWWIPTRRDELLHAVAEEIVHERVITTAETYGVDPETENATGKG